MRRPLRLGDRSRTGRSDHRRSGPSLLATFAAAISLAVIFGVGDVPATPGVFSLDRLRLGSVSGPEDYIFTVDDVVFPEGGADSGTYYTFAVTDGTGSVRNPGAPCRPAANFGSADNTYTIQASDPVSTSAAWKYTLTQFTNSTCTGSAAKTTSKAFYVAKAVSYADSGLATPQSAFRTGATAYVTIAGVKPNPVDWSTTWILPSSATACANTAGNDRPDASGSGILPKVTFLQFRPGSNGSLWNRESNYELAPCPAFGAANNGLWKLRVEVDATNFVVLPVFTVDTIGPNPSITNAPSNPGNDTSPSISFTSDEPGSSFQCKLDGASFSACSSPQSYTGLAEGSHTFAVTATDPAGNAGSVATYMWTIDTTAPPSPTITGAPADPSDSSSASFAFTDAEPGVAFVCQIDGGGFSSCVSPKTYTGLADGSHTFQVEALDPAGNSSQPATVTWTIDATAPSVTITASPSDPSNSASASFSFTSNKPGSTFECRLDGGIFSPCSSPKSYSSLSDGSHTFEVRATDAVGTGSPASRTWTVDTTAPAITLSVPEDGSSTSDTTPTFAGTAGAAAGDSASVVVKVYFGTAATGSPVQVLNATRAGDGSFSVAASAPLAGTYTAQAEQPDTAGNVGLSQANTFTVDAPDTTPPTVTLDSPPDGSATSSTQPSFTGTAGLAPGDSATVSVNVYTGTSAAGSPLLTLATNRQGNGSYAVVPGSPLVEGTYTAQAEQLDSAGNTGRSASHTFTIDTTAPSVTITTHPPDPSASAAPSFGFSANESGSTFECQLDAGGFSSCTDPRSYSGLGDGAHTFEVKAIDRAGNVGLPASFTWTIDATAPIVTLVTPAGGSSSTNQSPTFSGAAGTASGDSDTVTVKVYSGTSATGTPVRTLPTTRTGSSYAVDASPPLGVGTYTAQSEQADGVGNVGRSGTTTFTILSEDQTPPVVSLTSPANGSSTTVTRPTFSGTAGTAPGDGTAVTVNVYSGTSASGTPVQTLSTSRDGTGAYTVDASVPLVGGTYTAQAEQLDSAGNVGKSSANTFTISSGYRDGVLGDNPGAYWRLGEASGTAAADETGTNNGTYLNGVLLGQPGALQTGSNTAASFDGVNDYVSVSSSSSLNATSAVTVEAWVKRSRSGAWQNIVAKPGSGAAAAQNYALWINTSNQPVLYFGNGSSTGSVTSPTALDTNWHHVVATYDNATARIYVDGVLKASASSSVRLTANTQALTIGRSTDGLRIFGGVLDEVAVYPTALTATRIQAHYQKGNALDSIPPVVALSTPGNQTTTLDVRPHFAGGAEVTASDSTTVTVKVYTGSAATGSPLQTLTATIFPSGAWSVDASAALAIGTYTAQAEQSDVAGNVGKSVAATFDVVGASSTQDPVLVGAGDIADCTDSGVVATANLVLGFPSATVQTFGDNAYPHGSASDFSGCYDPTWGQFKTRTRPAIGDHEYETPNASGYFNYFASQLAPFGASASDPNRAYYSYDLGAWHVVVLAAACGIDAPGCDKNAQLAWLDADLGSHPNMCTLAVLHKNRFSSGSVHGSNALMQPYWNVLYANSADLVVGGDEHLYERYALQDPQGFYDPSRGLRQLIVGTGGGSLYTFGTPNANSEVRYRASYGVLKLTLHASSYEWRFVPTSGTFTDTGSTACH